MIEFVRAPWVLVSVRPDAQFGQVIRLECRHCDATAAYASTLELFGLLEGGRQFHRQHQTCPERRQTPA